MTALEVDTTDLVRNMTHLFIGNRPQTPPQETWIPLYEFSCCHHTGPLPIRLPHFDTSQSPYHIPHICHHCHLTVLLDQLVQIYVRHIILFDGAMSNCEKLKRGDPLRRAVLIRNALIREFNGIRSACAREMLEAEKVWIERWGPNRDNGLVQQFLEEARYLGPESFEVQEQIDWALE